MTGLTARGTRRLRAIRDLLLNTSQALTLTEMVKALGGSRSATEKALYWMLARGMVTRDMRVVPGTLIRSYAYSLVNRAGSKPMQGSVSTPDSGR